VLDRYVFFNQSKSWTSKSLRWGQSDFGVKNGPIKKLYIILHKFNSTHHKMADEELAKNNLQLLQGAIVCYAVVPWQTLVHGMLLRDVRRHVVTELVKTMVEDGFLHVSVFLGHKVYQTKPKLFFLLL
jgi:hypothetical protein